MYRYRVEAIGLSFEHSGLSMVCSLGALKLCELCPVKGTRLASYYAIGTDSVLGAVLPSGAPFHASMTYAGLKLAFVEHPRSSGGLYRPVPQYSPGTA